MTLPRGTLMNRIFQKIVWSQFLLKRIQLVLRRHSLQRQKEKESNKESDHEKAKNQLQNAKESTPEAIVIDNETVFSAEKILKHRKRNGKVEYLVKWLFFPKSQSTWEPEHHILDRRLIDNYLQSQK